VGLVKKFGGEFPERFADEIFRYLSIPEKKFPNSLPNVPTTDNGPGLFCEFG
jgi:hypothetical protein